MGPHAIYNVWIAEADVTDLEAVRAPIAMVYLNVHAKMIRITITTIYHRGITLTY